MHTLGSRNIFIQQIYLLRNYSVELLESPLALTALYILKTDFIINIKLNTCHVCLPFAAPQLTVSVQYAC